MIQKNSCLGKLTETAELIVHQSPAQLICTLFTACRF